MRARRLICASLVSCYPRVLGGFAILCLALFANGSHAQDSAARWSALGYPTLPEGFPDNDLTLLEGLNAACGKWTFQGVAKSRESTDALTGELSVTGSSVGGMYAGWALVFKWPTDSGDQAMQYTIMGTPSKTGFKWGLFVFDAEGLRNKVGAKPPSRPSHFEGSWNPDQQVITWTEKAAVPGEDATGESQRTFQMLIAADGKIEIKGAKDLVGQRLVIGKAIQQTAKAPKDKTYLSGKHQFQSADMVADPRIKPYLPSKATDIEIFSERGGHFAKYKVSLDDFNDFFDELWKRDGGESVTQRRDSDEEREPVGPSAMKIFRKVAGWDPLKDAISFSGPTKSNGAMTTFYYDRKTGTVYHDRGYW